MVKALRKATALLGLTFAASGLLAATAPTSASAAATCSSYVEGKQGFVACYDLRGYVRAVVDCEHLTSGRIITVQGNRVLGAKGKTVYSWGECGLAYRVDHISWTG